MSRPIANCAYLPIALLGCLGIVLPGCVPPPERSEKAPETQAEEAASVDPQVELRVANAPANGWGEGIAWRSFEEGQAEAKALGRPMMLVVWTSWCPNCRALKKPFSKNDEIRELSHQFVMVNVDQDELPMVSRIGPDGDYIPRVIFLDAEGEVDTAVLNSKRRRSLYFYSPVDDVPAKMREALERHPTSS